MPERTIELYGKQHDFVTCQDRFTAMIAGIGSGKTFAGAVKALVAMAETKGLGFVVAPTYPMLRDATLRTFKKVCDGAIVDFHKTEMRATMRGGGEVLFRSADQPDRLRGPNLHWAWLDEAALCPRMTWEIIIGRLRADGQAGPCWVTTTPRGRNWLYERADEMTIFRASTKDNPYLDDEFVRSLESAYTGKFAKQELHGDFVAFEGVIYEEFSHDVHVKRRDPAEFGRYIGGVDEGYTNPAVCLVIGVDADSRMHVCRELYSRRLTQRDLVGQIGRLDAERTVRTYWADPSAAGLIAAMREANLPVQAANHAVYEGIQAVKARLAIAGDGRPRLTVDPSCVNTIAEFESYSWKDSKVGLKDEPVKATDHAMDALRYAIFSEQHAIEGPIFSWA